MSSRPGADRLLAGREADQADPSERPDGRDQGRFEQLALDHVDHDVDALGMPQLGRCLSKVVLEPPVALAVPAVAEHPVGACRGRQLLFLRDADAGDHLRAHRLGELHRGHADAARCPVDQHEAAGTDLAEHFQRVVGREEVAAQVGAALQRNTVGGLPDGRRRYLDRLGEAAQVHLGDDPVAGPQVVDAVAEPPAPFPPRPCRARREDPACAGRAPAPAARRDTARRRSASGPRRDPAHRQERRDLVQRQDVPQRVGLRNRFSGFVEAGVAVTANGFHSAHGDSGDKLTGSIMWP